jgi:cytochrome c
MRKQRLCVPSLLLLLMMPLAEAQERGETLIQEKVCFGCHQMSSASIGPPWQAIAARHAPRKEVMVAVLASRIMRGGGGNWGLVPMVPNQRVNEEEARTLAAWVLQQTP